MSVNEYDTIGKRLRYLRKERGLTQREFSSAVGISQGNLSEMEKDKFLPSSETLISIIRSFAVSADWILTGEEKPGAKIRQTPQEVIFDPDMKEMIDVVKHLMSNPDPELRVWAKVQFRRAFAEFGEALKKEHA